MVREIDNLSNDPIQGVLTHESMSACRGSLMVCHEILSLALLIKDLMMEGSWIHKTQSIHAQIFTEHPLCTRHYRKSYEQNRPKALLMGLTF